MCKLRPHSHYYYDKLFFEETMIRCYAAKVLDFIQTAWIFDPSMFALDLINNNLDFHKY